MLAPARSGRSDGLTAFVNLNPHGICGCENHTGDAVNLCTVTPPSGYLRYYLEREESIDLSVILLSCDPD